MATPATFRTRLFNRLGIRETPATVAAFFAWALAEGPIGGGAWLYNNPLNTRKGMPGGMTDRPGTSVPGYTTEAIGIEATARTLEQNNFAGIRAAFRAGSSRVPGALRGAEPSFAEIRAAIIASPWAAGHYNNGRSFPAGVNVKVETEKVPKHGGVVGAIEGAVIGGAKAAYEPVQDVLSFIKFLGWLLQPGHWIRVAEVIGGAVVVIGGVALIAKDVFGVGIPVPPPARKAATVAADVAAPALEVAA